MRQGGLILAAGRVRSKKKEHEITGNSLIVVHTKKGTKNENRVSASNAFINDDFHRKESHT